MRVLHAQHRVTPAAAFSICQCRVRSGCRRGGPRAQGKLRIGLAEQTVLTALAHATLLQRGGAAECGNKDGGLSGRLAGAEAAVKLAYSQCPSYDLLVPALLAHPVMARPAAARGTQTHTAP